MCGSKHHCSKDFKSTSPHLRVTSPNVDQNRDMLRAVYESGVYSNSTYSSESYHSTPDCQSLLSTPPAAVLLSHEVPVSTPTAAAKTLHDGSAKERCTTPPPLSTQKQREFQYSKNCNATEFPPLKVLQKSCFTTACHDAEMPGVFEEGASLQNVDYLMHRGRFPTAEQRWYLPLTNQKTRFVCFSMKRRLSGFLPKSLEADTRVDVFLLCFVSKQHAKPLFVIPLTAATMVARVCSENGPCLYLSSIIGVFEFQCASNSCPDYDFWESQMRRLGVRIVLAHDLFVPVGMRLIGEGSFAKVYPATHRSTGTPVVIKMVPKTKLCQLPADHHSAVEVEIAVLRRINHPFIVNFYAAYEDESHYYIVLEQLAGGNAYEWLREHKRYTEAQARGAMFRLFAALVALNSKGVVHRDLKLENLVLEYPDDPSSIKLIDFGLAAFLTSRRMGMQCGSPGFVAPEIILGKTYGAQADMFSAGALLYAMLSGKAPFHAEGDTTSKTLSNNRHCEVHFDPAIWDTICADARDLVIHLTNRDPAFRPSPDQALMHSWMFGRIYRALAPESPILRLLHPSFWRLSGDLYLPQKEPTESHAKPSTEQGSRPWRPLSNWQAPPTPLAVSETNPFSTSSPELRSPLNTPSKSEIADYAAPTTVHFETSVTRLSLLGPHVNPLMQDIQHRNTLLYKILSSVQDVADIFCRPAHKLTQQHHNPNGDALASASHCQASAASAFPQNNAANPALCVPANGPTSTPLVYQNQPKKPMRNVHFQNSSNTIGPSLRCEDTAPDGRKMSRCDISSPSSLKAERNQPIQKETAPRRLAAPGQPMAFSPLSTPRSDNSVYPIFFPKLSGNQSNDLVSNPLYNIGLTQNATNSRERPCIQYSPWQPSSIAEGCYRDMYRVAPSPPQRPVKMSPAETAHLRGDGVPWHPSSGSPPFKNN